MDHQAQSQAASTTSIKPPGEFRMPGGEADELRSIIHPSLIEKAEGHDGQESTFPAWKFQFEALAALIGRDKQIDMCPTTSDAELALLNLDEDAEKKAKAFLAWKRICKEFLPEAGGRHNALLTALLHPDLSKGDFDINRAVWEKNIVMYESESGEKCTSRMQIATVCKYAPTLFSESMKVAAMTSMTDHGKFSDALKSVALTTKSYSCEGGVIPMYVGGIQGRGKGKGFGAGDLCHFCGAGHRPQDCWSKKDGIGKSDKGKCKGAEGNKSLPLLQQDRTFRVRLQKEEEERSWRSRCPRRAAATYINPEVGVVEA
eukprot:838370-Amphidinium_carterae.1